MSEQLAVETSVGVAGLDIQRPAASPRALLALGHGAGGGVDASDLLALRDAALSRGLVVARVTQPYRVAGKKAPPAAARLDAAWCETLDALRAVRGLEGLPLVVAGRSSGARVACRCASQVGAVAVIALAFPEHPPGKPEKSRLDELDSVRVATLVVQGDRDAFGMPVARSRPRRRVCVVAGADHSLRRAVGAVGEAAGAFLDGLKLG